MPNKKMMAKTMVSYAITMVNCRLCITLSHKQYEWHISCRHATCVHEWGNLMSSKAAWSLYYHTQHARHQPNITCKDQSAPGTSSTFLSMHKNIISHLIRFFHIPLANYEPCNRLGYTQPSKMC